MRAIPLFVAVLVLMYLNILACSKESLIEPVQQPEQQNTEDNSQDRQVYNFIEEYLVQDDIEYPLTPICDITFNTVSTGGGYITIESDCDLSDGYFSAPIANMIFTTDEILVLGGAGVFSWPIDIIIEECTESTIILRHDRQELNQEFYFIYEN